MKVAIGSKIVKGPWGGGNRFVIALHDTLLSQGHDVVFDLNDNDIDIILLTDPRSRIPNVSISTGMILRYLLFVNKNCIVVHRVNECDERKRTRTMNKRLMLANYVADHTIFVGSWLKKIAVWKNKTDQNSTVILNGADRLVFNTEGYKPWTGSEPLKLVTHHWGGNWMKGFDIYSAIDKLLQDNAWSKKIDFTYIGNLPKGFKFKNSSYSPPMQGKQLANELKRHHVYITGSINEPAGMHHIEGAMCGLPILYRNSGALPEYCNSFGIEYTLKSLVSDINKIIKEYDKFFLKMSEYPYNSDLMCNKYLKLFNNLYENKESIIKKRNLRKNYFYYLANRVL